MRPHLQDFYFDMVGDFAEFHVSIKPTTSGGTRTHNPRLRRPVPYPLGHRGLPDLLNEVVVAL